MSRILILISGLWVALFVSNFSHASGKAIALKGVGVNIGLLNNCGVTDKWTPRFDSINSKLFDSRIATENKNKLEWYKKEYVGSKKTNCNSPDSTIAQLEQALVDYGSYVDSYNKSNNAAVSGGLGTIPVNTPPPPGSIEYDTPQNPMYGLRNGGVGGRDMNISVPGVGNVNLKIPEINIGGLFGGSKSSSQDQAQQAQNQQTNTSAPSGKAHYVLGVSKKINGFSNENKVHPGWGNIYEETGLYAGILSKCEGRGVSWRSTLLSDSTSRAGADSANKMIIAYDQNFRYSSDGDMPCADFHMPTLLKRGDIYVSQFMAYKRS